MTARAPGLQAFIDAFHAAILARAAPGSPTAAAAARIFAALEVPGEARPVEPRRLGCCAHLARALDHAQAADAVVARLARAFGALEPHLAWSVRGNAHDVGEPFLSGHANAYFIGPGQLESRPEVMLGVSLMAPHINYPYHDHPPEEIYVALSPGDWQQNADPWVTPGMGGLVYNPPGIRHAMRSGPAPLLAAWCLWVG
ncbi:MAG: dimethylsulfoniopropionate lyase [Gammaproteobacteria bacterium]|nr:dimethylsulfoniopropionate lyase [Gammaproteobacteria bacterium]